MNAKEKQLGVARRAHRTRSCIRGTSKRPRLSVHRTLKHIYAQVIDDQKGVTLISASDKDVKNAGKPLEVSKAVGLVLAERALSAKISAVVFDRGSYRYHGRVASLAEGAREGGMKF